MSPLQLSAVQPGPRSSVAAPNPDTAYVDVCALQPLPDEVPETSSKAVPYELSQAWNWLQVKVTPASAPIPLSITKSPAWTETRYQSPLQL
jgi:hypothetical protein